MGCVSEFKRDPRQVCQQHIERNHPLCAGGFIPPTQCSGNARLLRRLKHIGRSPEHRILGGCKRSGKPRTLARVVVLLFPFLADAATRIFPNQPVLLLALTRHVRDAVLPAFWRLQQKHLAAFVVGNVNAADDAALADDGNQNAIERQRIVYTDHTILGPVAQSQHHTLDLAGKAIEFVAHLFGGLALRSLGIGQRHWLGTQVVHAHGQGDDQHHNRQRNAPADAL